MRLRARAMAGLARQLGHPRGLVGRLVGRFLDRNNARSIAAAVEALDASPGAVVADLGFGGGVGLRLLLERVGGAGHVHGVERSATMLAAAGRRYGAEVAGGRLELHHAAMQRLPLPDASLDGAITLNTIYFIADLPTAFAEIARALRPGGRLVVGLGDPEAMARLPFTRDFRLRPVTEVTRTLEDAGLRVAEERRGGSAAIPSHLLVAERA